MQEIKTLYYVHSLNKQNCENKNVILPPDITQWMQFFFYNGQNELSQLGNLAEESHVTDAMQRVINRSTKNIPLCKKKKKKKFYQWMNCSGNINLKKSK